MVTVMREKSTREGYLFWNVYPWQRERERETGTESEIEKQTHRQTEKERDRDRETETERDRERERTTLYQFNFNSKTKPLYLFTQNCSSKCSNSIKRMHIIIVIVYNLQHVRSGTVKITKALIS